MTKTDVNHAFLSQITKKKASLDCKLRLDNVQTNLAVTLAASATSGVSLDVAKKNLGKKTGSLSLALRALGKAGLSA